MKKILAGITTGLMLATLLATSVSVSIGDIKYEILNTTKAPVMDGKVTQAEYAGNAPIVLDGSGKNTEGTWTKKTWAKQILKFYYTWDKTNLYIGITVENDTSDSQAKLPEPGSGKCPFGQGDSVQLGFNPGSMINGTHPLIYCVGFNADGQPVVHGDAFQSAENGKQSTDVSSAIKGYCSKYSASGLNYQCEITIPWDKLCVNGAGRANEGSKVFNMTGERAKIGDGYMLPIFIVYTDCGDGTTHIRTDSTTGNKWVAEEMGSLALVLKEAKASAPVTTPATTPGTAPATADAGLISAFAALVSASAAVIVHKKRR